MNPSSLIMTETHTKTVVYTQQQTTQIIILTIYPDEPTWYDLSDKSAHDVTGISEVIDSFNGKLIVKTRGMNFKAITEEEL